MSGKQRKLGKTEKLINLLNQENLNSVINKKFPVKKNLFNVYNCNLTSEISFALVQ